MWLSSLGIVIKLLIEGACILGYRSHFGSRYQIVACYAQSVFFSICRPPPQCVEQTSGGKKIKKSWQHPKDFPSGPPPQYYPGPATVNFGVLKRSGVFVAVWPPATIISLLNLEPLKFQKYQKKSKLQKAAQKSASPVSTVVQKSASNNCKKIVSNPYSTTKICSFRNPGS